MYLRLLDLLSGNILLIIDQFFLSQIYREDENKIVTKNRTHFTTYKLFNDRKNKNWNEWLFSAGKNDT